ncbi:hypothetical protein NXS19_000083 [Fusarium pseudograminearum]|nr:hypothetical protein NXS19_000083 [Fusarium pseudograminearum]
MGHAVKCQDWHCGHTELNKFYGASDDRYVKLKGYIEDIKKPSALATADSVICKTSYSLDKLQITRLSGDPLPMDNCYINLGLIQLEKESATGQDLSQLALHARQGASYEMGRIKLHYRHSLMNAMPAMAKGSNQGEY